jgi:predicted HicB family RNase H-like nuclease
MKQEYDFSEGTRGKFYRPDAQFNLPVYLDVDVQTYLAAKAAQKGISLADLVNQLLQRDIEIIESTK